MSPSEKLTKQQLKEIKELTRLGRKYIWGGVEAKKQLEAGHVHLTRGNYYSPIASVAEIESSWEHKAAEPPYLHPDVYDNSRMRDFVESALIPYAIDFSPLSESSDSQTYYWKNPAFSFCDAMTYYCMIRHTKPEVVLEIGSGYSSLVAQQAIKDNGGGKLVMIEPYPMDLLRGISVDGELIEKPIQDVPTDEIAGMLGDNNILFIDSTHTVKPGGDCLYIYLKLLPALSRPTYLHVHDIYLPYPIPENWVLETQQHWMEQYLLQAYITENEKIEVLYGSNYHVKTNPDLARTLMQNKHPIGGGSFWIKKN